MMILSINNQLNVNKFSVLHMYTSTDFSYRSLSKTLARHRAKVWQFNRMEIFPKTTLRSQVKSLLAEMNSQACSIFLRIRLECRGPSQTLPIHPYVENIVFAARCELSTASWDYHMNLYDCSCSGNSKYL